MNRVTVLRIAAREEHIAGNYINEATMPMFDMQPIYDADPGDCPWHKTRIETHRTPVRCLQHADGKREYFACSHEIWDILRTIYEPQLDKMAERNRNLSAMVSEQSNRIMDFNGATLWGRLKMAWKGGI